MYTSLLRTLRTVSYTHLDVYKRQEMRINMDNQKLAELLFPEVVNTPEYYEEKFPYRKLPNKAEVTRMAPSPTGFIHLGNLYSCLLYTSRCV